MSDLSKIYDNKHLATILQWFIGRLTIKKGCILSNLLFDRLCPQMRWVRRWLPGRHFLPLGLLIFYEEIFLSSVSVVRSASRCVEEWYLKTGWDVICRWRMFPSSGGCWVGVNTVTEIHIILERAVYRLKAEIISNWYNSFHVMELQQYIFIAILQYQDIKMV